MLYFTMVLLMSVKVGYMMLINKVKNFLFHIKDVRNELMLVVSRCFDIECIEISN